MTYSAGYRLSPRRRLPVTLSAPTVAATVGMTVAALFATWLLAAWILACGTAQAADADVPPVTMTVTVNNKTSREVRVCLNYKNYPGTVWVTQGWWTVRAAEQASFTIPCNNSVAYFYARDNEGGPGWWGGKPGGPGSIRRPVIREDFLVPDERKPKGMRYRTVTMQRVRAEGRVFVINLSGS